MKVDSHIFLNNRQNNGKAGAYVMRELGQKRETNVSLINRSLGYFSFSIFYVNYVQQ